MCESLPDTNVRKFVWHKCENVCLTQMWGSVPDTNVRNSAWYKCEKVCLTQMWEIVPDTNVRNSAWHNWEKACQTQMWKFCLTQMWESLLHTKLTQVIIEPIQRYSQLHQINSNQKLSSGLQFANSVIVNCSYRILHTIYMAYWLVTVSM